VSDGLAITLISAPRPCPKCAQCRAMIARLQARHPGRLAFREIAADAPEAEDFGVVMPPMLILGDVILAAGRVPREDRLSALIADRLEEGSRA
jgi:hypothetical protein